MKSQFLRVATIDLDIQTIIFIENYFKMPRRSKFKKHLQAQAAHARFSRTSLLSDAQLPTPVPTSPSSLTVSTAPSKIPLADIVSGKESSNDLDVQESL